MTFLCIGLPSGPILATPVVGSRTGRMSVLVDDSAQRQSNTSVVSLYFLAVQRFLSLAVDLLS